MEQTTGTTITLSENGNGDASRSDIAREAASGEDRPAPLPTDTPPYSRIFVVCGQATEDELVEQFSPFGTIEYCKLLKDKQTGEPRGLAYIKFDKASAAAKAIEAMNDKQPWEDRAPLRVTIAEARGTPRNQRIISREPEDQPPRSRLFVLCSKETTEEDLAEVFRPFGDFEYCKVMRDRETAEPKGFAFVKFLKASTAAIAMEEVTAQERELAGAKLKVMIAEPKAKKTAYLHGQHGGLYGPRGYKPAPLGPPEMDPRYLYAYSYAYHAPYGLAPPTAPAGADAAVVYGYGGPAGYMPGPPASRRLYVVCGQAATRDDLFHLFAHFPGLEYVDVKYHRETGEPKGFAYVSFTSPQAAMYAKEQLDGYEFLAPGNRLRVMYADQLKQPANDVEGEDPEEDYAPPANPANDHATHLRHVDPAPNSHYPTQPTAVRERYPPQQHHHHSHFPEGSRLFVSLGSNNSSSTPPNVPDYFLQELFSRFGGLEYVRILKGKSFGYAKYTTSEAALQAMQLLNGVEINGTKLRVEIARPMKQQQQHAGATAP